MADSKHENVLFLRKLIGYWQGANQNQMPTLHDPLAILTTFQPELCTWETGRVEVETKGQPGVSYGLTSFKSDAKGTTKVAREVKSANAVDLFMTRVAAPPRK
jgi:inosine-uridine nucleoside N-ribohydrolase